MRPSVCVIIIAVVSCRSVATAQTDVDSPEAPSPPEQNLEPDRVADSIVEWQDCPDCIASSPASNAWRVGDFRVVPYGAFWADMVYGSRRTNTGAYTLWVFSREDQGEGSFVVDARRSRFGLNVEGPRIAALGGAQTSGQVEIDFHGEFIIENRASVLLRQAFWEAKDESLRILVGQHWDVISPLYPNTLNYPVGWNAGNIGFRRAQFRLEKYHQLAWLKITTQFSLNQDIVSDFVRVAGIRRESTSWPVLEGRMAFGIGSNPKTELGISGHIGEAGFDFLEPGPPPLNLPPEDDVRFRTWSFNVDYRTQITDRLSFQGELFTGANLSAYLGGIGQGVCPCLRVPIRSSGGWLDLGYQWNPNLRSHIGCGIDDPRNNDLLFGRSYNHFIFANISVDLSEHLTTGIEVTSWKTLYLETRQGQIPAQDLGPTEPGESVTIDWMVKYAF